MTCRRNDLLASRSTRPTRQVPPGWQAGQSTRGVSRPSCFSKAGRSGLRRGPCGAPSPGEPSKRETARRGAIAISADAGNPPRRPSSCPASGEGARAPPMLSGWAEGTGSNCAIFGKDFCQVCAWLPEKQAECLTCSSVAPGVTFGFATPLRAKPLRRAAPQRLRGSTASCSQEPGTRWGIRL
jgi:hypothetical protein